MNRVGRSVVLGFAVPGLLSQALILKPLSHFVAESFDWRSRSLVEFHGIDCGEVGADGDKTAATGCALKAQSQGRPFRIRYEMFNLVDVPVAKGLVRTRSGQLYSYYYHHLPLGGRYVDYSACPKPNRLWIDRNGYLTCRGEAHGGTCTDCRFIDAQMTTFEEPSLE